MRSLSFWLKVSRPHHCVAAGLGAWIAALLSNGSDWWSPAKEASATTMAFGCLGASLYHYGAANKMYARKDWDVVNVSHPAVLIILGLVSLIASVTIAARFLPAAGLAVVSYNAIAVVCYAHFLAKHWTTKNFAIAIVCASPVLVGWLAGHRTNPVVPLGLIVIFSGYWAREILKDINDIEANNGIRVTLPMQIGIPWARRIAGCFAASSVAALVALLIMLTGSASTAAVALCGLTIVPFVAVAFRLFRTRTTGNETFLIVLGTWLLMLTFLGIRISQS